MSQKNKDEHYRATVSESVHFYQIYLNRPGSFGRNKNALLTTLSLSYCREVPLLQTLLRPSRVKVDGEQQHYE
jgi:hypothetical protein